MTQFSTPTKAYLVCATPRSGSTLLCEMLRETGRAGVPLEHFEILRHSSLPRQPREYFEDLDAPHVIELLAPVEAGTASNETAEDWWARIVAEGSTSNGIWGGKIMWGHTEDFVARARQLPGLSDADLDAVLRELLDDPELVFVTRGDKAAQAVSLWRAIQTQSWRSGEPPRADSVVYDFEAIDHLVSQLESDERAWSEWFARTGRRPIHVTYDRLDSAPGHTVEVVLHALGLPDSAVAVPRLARPRDDLSAAWIERYRRERGRAA
ncbi:MAG: Stf0 family sulfotransferase [Solirubrobacteraceae bacterium]